MATIYISDLRPTGSDLFSDSESYINDLDDNEFGSIQGGLTPGAAVLAFRVGYAAARSSQQCAIGIAGAVNGVNRWLNRD